MSLYDVVPVGVADYRRRAQRRLPKFLFDYADGAANAERTAALNQSDFNRWRLKQYVMRDVSEVNTNTTLLGEAATMPLILAPVGMAGMYARRGEVQAAKAAATVGIPFTASTVGICSIEEIQAASERPFWFQLYMMRDRGFVLELLTRAQAAGCTVLVVTVDLAVPGMRLRDLRNGMSGASALESLTKLAQILSSPCWAYDVGLRGGPHDFGNLRHKVANAKDLAEFKRFVSGQFDASVTWADIAWLRQHWRGKLLVKGVMEAEDALAAVDAGANGIVVSNHGGRQLDGISSSISKLPQVVRALAGKTEILFDGGVRDGIDIIKALALGAQGVLIGRPWVYALASGGEPAVTDLLRLLQREISIALALMGVTCIEDLSAEHLELLA